jgi:hypothetical protein
VLPDPAQFGVGGHGRGHEVGGPDRAVAIGDPLVEFVEEVAWPRAEPVMGEPPWEHPRNPWLGPVFPDLSGHVRAVARPAAVGGRC